MNTIDEYIRDDIQDVRRAVRKEAFDLENITNDKPDTFALMNITLQTNIGRSIHMSITISIKGDLNVIK